MDKTSTVVYFLNVIAEKLSAIEDPKLTKEQVLLVIELAKRQKDCDFIVTMPKVRRFKLKPDEVAIKWEKAFVPDELVTKCWISSIKEKKNTLQYLCFTVNQTVLIERTLKQVFAMKDTYGGSDLLAGKKYIVEYSSPNIAKPFHAGHLRSTIIGNFLAKLFSTLGADVTSINYLGDWGKQYGLLALAWKQYGDEEKLNADPIMHLFDLYVQINKEAKEDEESRKKAMNEKMEADKEYAEKLNELANAQPQMEYAKNDKQRAQILYTTYCDLEKIETVHDKARKYFKGMEDGEEEPLKLWSMFRNMSIKEYKKIYERLGVSFDVYAGESEVSEGMKVEFKKMVEKGLLTDDRGAKLIDLKKYKLGKVIVQKSDGATLYITRDIATAVSRYNEYNFDRMFYVVAAPQDLHFKQLFKTLELMGYDWAKRCKHVNFGMVLGMSTRNGNVVFLSDIIEMTKKAMMERMSDDKMGKLKEVENQDETSDNIALSAIFVQDFSAKRIKDYKFDKKRMTDYLGHTGPFLQYTNARLSSMKDKNNVEATDDIDYTILKEPVAFNLAKKIAEYPDVLLLCSSDKNLEPSTLVTYLFDLAHCISLAHQHLYVKGTEEPVAKARTLLYWSALTTLQNAMKILGMSPVNRM